MSEESPWIELDDLTWRMPVSGGYLYKTTNRNSVAMVYVPHQAIAGGHSCNYPGDVK